MKRYNPIEIEKKWQQIWEQNETYKVDFSDHTKPKYYAMSMLPGITGAGIHTGHGRTFQFSDIKVRAKRQQGYNAYHPIGWDSFGLPVENYAIKLGKKPREAHDEALVNFKRQLKRLGYSYDWSKEISTADPSYYRWTQWIFNKLFEHGLAYQKQSPQWWCETDQTVLANEQVEGGKCWRCGNQVVKKNLKQWFFKITDYADEMLEATDDLDWTPMVKTMQKNWIGRSVGAEVEFKIENHDEIITVFTTRPDTLFGATFIVLAPENELVEKLVNTDTEDLVNSYIQESARKSEVERMNESREKTGVFTGSYAINPVNGEKLPIWVADYVLAGYGTGAIMAVPAHDERDFAFAEKFNLPIINVIAKDFGEILPDAQDVKGSVAIIYDYVTKKFGGVKRPSSCGLWLNGGGKKPGESFEQTAIRELAEETGFTTFQRIEPLGEPVYSYYFNDVKKVAKRSYGQGFLFYVDANDKGYDSLEDHEKSFNLGWYDYDELVSGVKLTDGGVDHWLEMLSLAKAIVDGEEIKTLYNGEGILTNSGDFDGMSTSEAREKIVTWLEKDGTGRIKTTYKMRDWLISRQRYWGAPIPIIHCEDCGAVPVPDDQLPVILPDVDDFKPHGGATSALASVADWVNTTCPKCGKPAKRETDTMDGYACSSWYFLRYLDPFNDKQAWDPENEKYWGPVDFYNGADHAVAHLLYSRFWMRFFYKIGLVSTSEPFKRMMYNAYIMAPDGTKMSKSKGNTIDPLEIMDSGYGADSLRVYEMFIAPYDIEAPWDTRGVPGTHRFLNRIWTLVQEYIEADEVILDDSIEKEILAIAHRTVKKVTKDINDDKFNTAVSAMMEAVNSYYKLKINSKIGKSSAWKFAIESLLQILSPFAPHITEELWSQIGHSDTIHVDHWPEWDDKYLQLDIKTIIVQVNGKLRAKLEIDSKISDEDIKKMALTQDNVIKFIDGKEPIRVVYVPGKLVNIVIAT
ncbi:MAG: leucyl-tRNA synthetase [Patescibacteria group bacterium]|nr:leucyl-tRNA synthetase [Patescibacteria group bacterium]